MGLHDSRLYLYTDRISHLVLRQGSTSDPNVTDHGSFLKDKIGDYLWTYLSPVLLLVGTVGNVLSVLVLLRRSMRPSTTMFYLTCLSVGDLFTLYTGLLRYWVRAAFDTDVRTLSDLGCKIHVFLVYVSLDFTVWVLVSVTVDRCLSVTLPFKSRRVCTLSRCKVIVLAILLVLSVKNMHFLWNLEVTGSLELRCDGRSASARHFYGYVWPWIDFSIFCPIPFSIMIVCNVKIIYEMMLSQRKLRSHRSVYGKSTVAPDVPLVDRTPSMMVPTLSRVDSTPSMVAVSRVEGPTTVPPTLHVTSTHSVDATQDITQAMSNSGASPIMDRVVRFKELQSVNDNKEAQPVNNKEREPVNNKEREPVNNQERQSVNNNKELEPVNNNKEREPVNNNKERQPVNNNKERQPDNDNKEAQSDNTTNTTTLPQKRKPMRRLSTLTAMLLTVNCVFLLTTTPIQVFLIGEHYWFSTTTPEGIARHNFYWAIVNMLMYSNNCVHFFLYCLTGPRFRYELKCMFSRNHRVSSVCDRVSGTMQ